MGVTMYVLKRDTSRTSVPMSNPYLTYNEYHTSVTYTENLSRATKFQSIPELLGFIGKWNMEKLRSVNGGDHLTIVEVEQQGWEEVREVT